MHKRSRPFELASRVHKPAVIALAVTAIISFAKPALAEWPVVDAGVVTNTALMLKQMAQDYQTFKAQLDTQKQQLDAIGSAGPVMGLIPNNPLTATVKNAYSGMLNTLPQAPYWTVPGQNGTPNLSTVAGGYDFYSKALGTGVQSMGIPNAPLPTIPSQAEQDNIRQRRADMLNHAALQGLAQADASDRTIDPAIAQAMELSSKGHNSASNENERLAVLIDAIGALMTLEAAQLGTQNATLRLLSAQAQLNRPTTVGNSNSTNAAFQNP